MTAGPDNLNYVPYCVSVVFMPLFTCGRYLFPFGRLNPCMYSRTLHGGDCTTYKECHKLASVGDGDSRPLADPGRRRAPRTTTKPYPQHQLQSNGHQAEVFSELSLATCAPKGGREGSGGPCLLDPQNKIHWAEAAQYQPLFNHPHDLPATYLPD